MSRDQTTTWENGSAASPDLAAANRVARVFSVSNLLLMAAVVILTGYGYLVFHAGTQLLPTWNPDNDRTERINKIMEVADTDPQALDQNEIDQLLPDWMRVIAASTNDGFIYGSDSVMESEAYYHSMSDIKRNVLSTHMMLGLVLMVAGILQFLPMVRRKYRTLHKISGRLFVAAVVVSMSMSAYHLLTTEIGDVFADFVFFSGLWILWVWTLGSMAVSVWALVKKKYALHLGWAAMAFSALLSAPVQRGSWVLLGPFAGDRSFNEMNIVVTPGLFLVCALLGYFLFCVNRNSSPLKAGAHSAPANWAVPNFGGALSLILVGVVSVVASFIFLVFDGGLVAGGYAGNLMPASAIDWHDKVFTNASPAVLWVSSSITVLACVKLLLADANALSASRGLSLAAVLSGLVSTAVLIAWGYELGLPDWNVIMGGAFYFATGVVFAGFLLAFASRQWLGKSNPGKTREMLWFVFGLSLTPGLFYLSMIAVSYSELVPAQFLVSGDGYQLACAFALTIPSIIGFLAAIHSAETRRFAVN